MNELLEYIKDKEVVLVNEQNVFDYETCVYDYHDKTFGLCNSAFHSSPTPIPNIVKCFWKSRNIQICSSLYSAPEKWLQDNEYVRYIAVKKVRNKTKKKANNE